MRASYLAEWSTGKPLLLGIVAAQVAAYTDGLVAMLAWSRSSSWSVVAKPTPSLADWLRCYRHPTEVCMTLASQFPPIVPTMTNADLARSVRRLQSTWLMIPLAERQELLAQSQREPSDRSRRVQTHLARRAHHRIQRELSGEDHLALEPVDWAKAFAVPAVQFFYRVTVPSLIEYGLHPTLFFRRARRGDLDALENLLRLDWSVIHDPVLADRIHQLRATPKSPAYRRIVRAIAKGPYQTLTSKQVKIRLGAFVRMLSLSMGHPLTARSVRDLFDGAAKDGGAGLCDSDLPPAPETLEKALNRERSQQHWMPISA